MLLKTEEGTHEDVEVSRNFHGVLNFKIVNYTCIRSMSAGL